VIVRATDASALDGEEEDPPCVTKPTAGRARASGTGARCR
jgi:hypothetical protein